MHALLSNAEDPASRVTETPGLVADLSIPLVLDLDGTLLRTDTLQESLIIYLKRGGYGIFEIPSAFAKGRAALKAKLAACVSSDDVASFPVCEELLELARHEHSIGRRIILATAADRSIAEMAGQRFPFISEIIGSDGQHNLKGSAKADELVARFPEGFLYAGDSTADIEVWSRAAGAIYVGNSASIAAQAEARTRLLKQIPVKPLDAMVVVRAARLHQWAKNALIFVPLVLGGKFDNPSAWLHAFVAFLSLGLLASSTYLLNDMWDLSEDRKHWSKKNRPLANGDLSISNGVLLMGSASILAVILAAMIGRSSVFILLTYLVISLSYSFRFKVEPITDVFLLATLFSMRLAIGVVATKVVFSPWLIVFSMFLFLSLSFAKRQTEITRMVEHGREKTLGRGYVAADAPLVLALGVGAMMATVLIMVIYLVDYAFPTGFYRHPTFLWGFAVIIFLWLSRIWLLCHRGEMNDDPVVFALKDHISLFYGAMMVLLFLAAIS